MELTPFMEMVKLSRIILQNQHIDNMKMKKLIYLFILINSLGYSQENSEVYFRKKIDNVESNIKNILNGRQYIIYSTPYELHLILNKQNRYYEFIFKGDYDNEYELYDFNIINDNIMQDIFNVSNYEAGIISTDSEFYRKKPLEIIDGLSTYFSFNTDYQKRYCEYFLTIFVKPVPMNKEIYQYLSFKMLNIEKE